MQSIKDATPRIILKHDLKEADAVQYIYLICASRQDVNISNKKAKCPFILNKKAKMCLYCSPGYHSLYKKVTKSRKGQYWRRG